ncbi:MAG TPA: nuclear transport factor 2 family protein [Acidimicrobiales bacterium]|nr:nuclear transport factor 2 family protein [Acidimicrobiales bacterium]
MPATSPLDDRRRAVADELHDLAVRYAAGADRRDGEMFAGAFLPGGRLRVFDPPEAAEPRSDRQGHDALVGVPALLSRYERTFHLLGQASYELGPGGDEAEGEVYCLAHHRLAGPPPTTVVMHIRYRDRYRRAGGRWGIDERRVLVDWTETRPAGTSG